MSELMTANEWYKYRDMLKKISKTAADEFSKILAKRANYQGFLLTLPREEIIEVANALVQKYGEAAAEAACQMHEEIAERSGVSIPPAEPAEVADIHEVAKAINGAAKSGNEKTVASTVGRLVKQAGQDTTHKNAARDGAQWAWIPSGDTCAFCMTLASNGWQYASQAILKGGHVEHIHANCDCAFAIRFKGDQKYGGYDPEKYKRMYYGADGNTSKDRINAMRREIYEENKDQINAQKREAYAKRTYNPDKERVLTERLSFSYNGTPEFIPLHTIIKKPYAMAGKGTDKEIRDVERLAAVYGVDASEWKKMAGKIVSEKYQFDIHWYECDDEIVREPKIKYMKEIK